MNMAEAGGSDAKSALRQRRGVTSAPEALAAATFAETKQSVGAPGASSAEDAAAADPCLKDDKAEAGAAPPSARDGDWLERHRRWLPLLVFAVAAFVRFYRLDCPNGVVFDESHFGRFTNQYTKGEFHFDSECE